METLGDALPKEMARVTKMIERYSDPLLNGSGQFAIILMRRDLDAAANALATGDIAEMVRVYQSLKEFEG